MKLAVAALLLVTAVLAPSEAMACRDPPDPPEIKEVKADAIVLAVVTKVEPTIDKWGRWGANASWRGNVLGEVGEREFRFEDQGPGSCYNWGPPKLGNHWVLFLAMHEGGYRVFPMPYWWAKKSGDPRVAGLRTLLPLGPVREPTFQEQRLIHLAEQRSRLLGDYTRIYARSSAGSLRVKFFRSKTPQLLMVDLTEELPTPESCACELHEQYVELQDLWEAGKLPPFDP